MMRKIGKSDEDLTQTDMMLVDFEGNVSPTQGAICVELTIGSKNLPTTFFVIKGRGSYNLLLETTRISANGIPNLSTSVVVPGGLPRAIPVSAMPKTHTERQKQ
jgi:hypothetical protein